MCPSSRRFFAVHGGAFAAAFLVSFFLSQALGWGLAEALFSLSLPNVVVLSAMVVIGWAPHAILMAADPRLRRVNPVVTGAVGAAVLVAIPHAAEYSVQQGWVGTTASEISGPVVMTFHGLCVAASLLAVVATGFWQRSDARMAS